MPRIRQLEIVRALAQHRHFGRAAQALGMSQPNLTRGLKQLEALLGVPIFDRQGVTPTSFGEIILRHGDKALASFHELTRELSLAKGSGDWRTADHRGPIPRRYLGRAGRRNPAAQASEHIRRDPQRELGARDRGCDRGRGRPWIRRSDRRVEERRLLTGRFFNKSFSRIQIKCIMYFNRRSHPPQGGGREGIEICTGRITRGRTTRP